MRKGLTLIELIFTMVIVAITFTVVPKLVQTIADTGKTIVKEDAIFNTITMMGLITRLAWDEENVINDSILNVSHGNANYTCNPATRYRRGGFVGGRNCITAGAIPNASNPLAVPTPPTYNSIDSYNGYSLGTKTSCGGGLYDLGVRVTYNGAVTSNVKHIEITTNYNAGFKLKNEGCIMFDYFSYNIGQVSINKRRWQ